MGGFIFDHNSIHTSLKSANPHPIKKKITYRKSKAIGKEKFTDDIQSSHLLHLSPSHVDDMVICYNKVLRELLDNHAPLRTQTIAIQSPQLWINKNILEAKRTRRSAERRWRKTTLTVHRQQYKQHCEEVKELVKKAKADFYVNKINECSGDQKQLFKIVDKLLGREKDHSLPRFIDAKLMAQTFNEFFVTKIANIRISLSALEDSTDQTRYSFFDSLLSPSSSKLCHFESTTVSEVTDIIKKSSNATCILDPIPTSLLGEVVPFLAPVIVEIVNKVLSSGIFPNDLKAAIIHPLLKKTWLRSRDTQTFSSCV